MLRRLRSLFHILSARERYESDLSDEIEFHLESCAEDLIEAGHDPAEARRLARQRFGAEARVRSETRRASGLLLIDEAARNLRLAVRSARRSPLFSLTVIMTLGLCIGAAMAVFAVTDAVLWRPPPYPDHERLGLIVEHTPGGQLTTAGYFHDGRTWERLQENAGPIPRAAFSDWVQGVNLVGPGFSAHVDQQRVSAGFFSVLGVQPDLGRVFTPNEDRPGGDAVVILSHALWHGTFASDPGILDRTIRLKGEAHTVIGVMPEGFVSSLPADLWTPLRPSTSGEGSGTNYQFITRIPADMSRSEALARLAAIPLDQPVADTAPPRGRLALAPLKRSLAFDLRSPLLILFGAVLILLIVGCTNLASLLLSRAASRRTEISTRLALGGGTRAIVRQMLAESLVLAGGGALAGFGCGLLGMRGLELLARSHFGVWQAVQLDLRVAGAALLLSVLATVLFGLAPAWEAGRTNLSSALTGGGRRVLSGGGHRLRRFFLIAEVALVVTLLFSAGLLLRTWAHLGGLEPGFEPEGVVTVRVSLDDARYVSDEALSRLIAESVPLLQAIPGVADAGLGLTLPYERALNMPFRLPGVTAEGEWEISNLVYITPGYLTTLGIPLLAGRGFESSDATESEPVVLVNRAFADMYLEIEEPASGAIGRSLTLSGVDRRIAGIVGDVQQLNAGWGGDDPIWAVPTVYMPAAQVSPAFLQLVHTWFQPAWVVKSTGPAAAVTGEIRAAITSLDPELPIADLSALSETVHASLARPRFNAGLLTAIAAFALLLAAVGLWGLVANEVIERSPEMGVRMALGATPTEAVRAAARPGLTLAGLGLIIGVVVALAGAGLLRSLISGVAPFDPLTLVGVVGVLLGVAVAASFLPARRIARLDPAATLRRE